MTPLERCWYPAAWSHELRSRPVAARVLGRKVVAFRDAGGAAVVLEDRCPHRGAALSAGAVVSGRVQCPYHGWEFEGSGRCAYVPSLAEGRRLPQVEVPSYPVREAWGVVWFCFADEPAEPDPPRWHHWEDRTAFTTTIDIKANYLRVMENLVDNPHAGFLHAGLLRSAPSTPVVAHIQRSSVGVHIRTIGERAQGSILARLFGRRGEEFEHTEEFVAPYVIKTFFGRDAGHISSQFLCVPTDDENTRWFCRLTLDFNVVSPVLLPVFKAVVLRILHQDRRMLEQIIEQERLYPGRRRVSTDADAPSIIVVRAARRFAEMGSCDEPEGRRTEVVYRL
jgi:phenylpropionate dioxygenase-like ring-hydroxylating dioxygenase large terminal subunit